MVNPAPPSGGDVQEAAVPNTTLTLEEALKQLNLSSFYEKFENEQMDMDTLVRKIGAL